MAKSEIQIGEGAVEHVLELHIVVGIDNWGKSVFSSDEDFRVLVQAANAVSPIKQATGRDFMRIVDAGRSIGIDRATGSPTSLYTVIPDAANNLVIVHPGVP